jgi:Trypsin
LTAAYCDLKPETNELWNSISLQKRPVRVGAIANSTWSSFFSDGRRHWTIDTFFDDDAIEVPVYNQSYYPGFDNNTYVGDYLLLQLEDKVCIDGPSLTLNEESDLPLLGTELTVVGLGEYVQDETLESGISPPQLLYTTYNVLDNETCTDLFEDIMVEQNITLAMVDDESMFCAINLDDGDNIIGGQATCYGDAGGPVVYIEEDGSQILMGIVSWGGDPCGGPFVPDVNARVSFAMDWIKMVVCDEWGEEASFCPGGVTSCSDDVEQEDKKEKEDEEEDKEDKDDEEEDKEDKDD